MDQNAEMLPENSAERLPPAEPSVLGKPHTNGNGTGHADDLDDLLGALQIMRTGDFSVRLPGNRIGVVGKIADTLNEIVAANQRMAQQLERVGQLVGREGKTSHRVRFGLSDGLWGEM